MNQEEIKNMQPGRELDALVAEKVMGWFRNEKYGFWCKSVVDSFSSEIPNYSTDISAAWEVEEELTQMEEMVQIWYINYLESCTYRLPAENKPMVAQKMRIVHASAADRCRAALLAVNGGEQT